MFSSLNYSMTYFSAWLEKKCTIDLSNLNLFVKEYSVKIEYSAVIYKCLRPICFLNIYRSILGISWQDHITNLVVVDQAKSTSIEATIIKAQLRWVGHVIRMEDFWISRKLMYRELQAGKRNQGRLKLQYKETVKPNLQWCHINLRDLEGYAIDRPKWQGLVHRAAASFEEVRCKKFTAV